MLRTAAFLIVAGAPALADVPEYPACIDRLAQTYETIRTVEEVRTETQNLFIGAPANIIEGTDAQWIGPSGDAAKEALEAYADDLAKLCEAVRVYPTD